MAAKKRPLITLCGVEFTAQEIEYVRLRDADGNELTITPKKADAPEPRMLGFAARASDDAAAGRGRSGIS